jgi:hypothetical protein
MVTTTDDLAAQWVDDMMRLVAMIRGTKPRDPLRALEDALLDLRGRL